MKILFLFLFSLSLHASMGSSVTIGAREHLKYSFGNHINHPVQKIEKAQYYRSLAKMSDTQIMELLSLQGYVIHKIQLRDIASELVYQVHTSDKSSKRFVLYVDPTNGLILKTKPL